MFWLVVGCVTSCLAVKTQPSPTPVYWRLEHPDTDTGSLLAGGQSSPLLLPPGQQQRGGRQHKDQLLWLAAVDIYTCGEEMRKIPIRFFVFYLLLPDSDKIKKNHNKFVTRQDRESSDSTSIYWRGSLDRVLEFFKSNFHLDIPLVTILFLVCWISDVNCQAVLIYLGEHKHSLMNMKIKTRLECAPVAKYFF